MERIDDKFIRLIRGDVQGLPTQLLRLILLCLSKVYGGVVRFRLFMFQHRVFRKVILGCPVISVGNITVGGTGKTPHVAYLMELLHTHYKVAVLSRGYGRISKGFKLLTEKSIATKVGDEPLMLKQKFKNAIVAVDENRVNGINQILQLHPEVKTILLDDAFQHRAVKAHLSIVLVDYNQPVFNDFLLPAGRLRENKSALSRANIIIVSKTPNNLSVHEQKEFEAKLNLLSHQQLYFSFIVYGNPIAIESDGLAITIVDLKDYDCLLLSGIANATPLLNFIQNKAHSVKHFAYQDHYNYLLSDVKKIKNNFDAIKSEKKILLTTEKDFTRLNNAEFKNELKDIAFYYLPIEVQFHNTAPLSFNDYIMSFLSNFVASNY